MATERIKITPDRIFVNDASGNTKFDTDFKYLKTVATGGTLQLTQLATTPAPQGGSTTLYPNSGHAFLATFNPVTHTDPANPAAQTPRILFEPKVRGYISLRPCIMATANDSAPGNLTSIISSSVAFATIRGSNTATFYYTPVNTSNGVVAYVAHGNFLQTANSITSAVGLEIGCDPNSSVEFTAVRNTQGVNFDFTIRPLITLYLRWYSQTDTLPLLGTT